MNDVDKVTAWREAVLRLRAGEYDVKVPRIEKVSSEAFELVKDMVKEYGYSGKMGLPSYNDKLKYKRMMMSRQRKGRGQ